MPDIASIASAIGSLKTAADIAKGFLDLKEAAAVQGRVIELQGVILAAQSSALAAQSDQTMLLEEIRHLKEKVAKLEAWEAEKQRYQLTDFGGGTFAYVLRPDAANGQPSHNLCATCFNQGRKTILQHSQDNWFTCHACKDKIRLGTGSGSQSPQPNTDSDPFNR
jgi:hypothetical protein